MILIAGDSWGCGELSAEHHDMPLHQGLPTYFGQDGVDVINISKPGGSNFESIEKIKFFLRYNPVLARSVRHVLVFQTEWVRDSIFYEHNELKQELKQGYQILKSRWIARFYYHLSDIFVEFGVPIHVLGGCSDTDYFPDFETAYPGVKILCQSITNLLLNQDHRVQVPVFWQLLLNRKFADLLRSHNRGQDLEHLMNDLDIGLARMKLLEKNPKFFWPDGVHPNRESLAIVYKFLTENYPFLLDR